MSAVMNWIDALNSALRALGDENPVTDGECDLFVNARLQSGDTPEEVAASVFQHRADSGVHEIWGKREDEGRALNTDDIIRLTQAGFLSRDASRLVETELDDLDIDADLAAAAAKPGANPEPEIDELDALLDESLGLVKEEKAIKAARDRIKKGGFSYAESAEDRTRVAEWEAKHEWEATANAALFTRSICVCGHHNEQFESLMRHEKHRHLKTVHRWRAVKESLVNLPNQTLVRTSKVTMCWHCAPSKGFLLSQATELPE